MLEYVSEAERKAESVWREGGREAGRQEGKEAERQSGRQRVLEYASVLCCYATVKNALKNSILVATITTWNTHRYCATMLV